MNVYDTNIENLTCSCEDFIKERIRYSINDPRRLCKHIISCFPDDKSYEGYINDTEVIVPSQFFPFGKTISTCKLSKKGFHKYKDFYIYENFIIANGHNHTYIDVWINKYNDSNGKYIDNYWYEAIFKDDRTYQFDGINKFFSAHWYGGNYNASWIISSTPSLLICYAISNLFNIALNKFDVINFDNHYKNNDIEINIKKIDTIYEKYNTLEKLLREINAIHHFPNLPISLDKEYEGILYLKDNTTTVILCNMQKFEELNEIIKQKIDAVIINSITFDELASRKKNKFEINIEKTNYKIFYQSEYQPKNIAIKQLKQKKEQALVLKEKQLLRKAKKLINIQKEILKELNTNKRYLSTEEALELCYAPFSCIIFNRFLKKLNMIEKIEYKLGVFSKWILVNDGLKYGDNINYSTDYGGLSYIETVNLKPFLWIEYKDNEYIRHNDYFPIENKKLFPHTTIKWKADFFLELYKIIRDMFDEKDKPKSQKKEIREKWLKNIECPDCQGKNIHKKDIRQRKEYKVQRYQCVDCKKIFQTKIELVEDFEITNESKEYL